MAALSSPAAIRGRRLESAAAAAQHSDKRIQVLRVARKRCCSIAAAKKDDGFPSRSSKRPKWDIFGGAAAVLGSSSIAAIGLSKLGLSFGSGNSERNGGSGRGGGGGDSGGDRGGGGGKRGSEGSLHGAVLGESKKDGKKEDEQEQGLVEEVSSAVIQHLSRSDVLAKSSETGALKRLQKEAFTDIMKLREKLDKLELGVSESKSSGLGRTTINGRMSAGGAFVLMHDVSSYNSRSALDQAGLPAGLEAEFTFKTPFRDDKDTLTTKFVAGDGTLGSGAAGGSVRLSKISYSTKITDETKVSFVPLGAQATDMTEVVNPLQGEALTKFTSSGPALLTQCKGSAIGATYRSSNSSASLSEYISGWGDSNGPLCLSTLAQFIHQPIEQVAVSISAVSRFWPSPPLPSTPGLHWSEMKPFVLSKSIRSSGMDTSRTSGSSSAATRNGDRWSLEASGYEPKGTAMQSFAASAEMDLGGAACLGGWIQVDRGDWLQDLDQKRLIWSLSLAQESSAEAVGWGVSLGRSKRDFWSSLKEEEADLGGGKAEMSSTQLQVEAFLKIELGQGFSLQPGLLYVLNKQCQTPALMVKGEWKL